MGDFIDDHTLDLRKMSRDGRIRGEKRHGHHEDDLDEQASEWLIHIFPFL
jgi:hypothetical protein